MKMGANIITAFELLDGRRILVNRGFVSHEYLEPETRKLGQIENEHEICGLIRLTDQSYRHSVTLGKGDSEKGEYIRRVVEDMAKDLETEPIFIDLERAYGHKAGPIAGQTFFDFPNNHLLYCIHWWALSILGSI